MGDFLANHLLLPDGIPFKETFSSILGWLNCPLFIYIYTLNGIHQIFQKLKNWEISHPLLIAYDIWPNYIPCVNG